MKKKKERDQQIRQVLITKRIACIFQAVSTVVAIVVFFLVFWLAINATNRDRRKFAGEEKSAVAKTDR